MTENQSQIQPKETLTLQLDDKEKAQLLTQFSKFDKDTLKSTFEAISMMVRAFDGKAVEPDDVITRLINVKHTWERSRFPSYIIVARQVYLRLLADTHPEATACKEWADYEAEALIPYKGENWDYYVKMLQAQSGQREEQQTTFNFSQPNPAAPAKYGRIFNRKPKETTTEGE